MNTGATDRMASTPDGSGGLINIPGDWHETMSTHWFHDHMFSFTSQNVYKGNAAMFNLYSGLDRGNEEIDDGVNLRLPSGSAKDWGNLDYDVNLMLADKAFDQDGQMYFDIFNFDGFIGDVMTTNLAYNPYFEVERRKYRFRILNASVSRFFKVALANASGAAQPIMQIGNDGNLLPHPVTLLGARRAGHRRALRHRHRLLELLDRRQAPSGQPLRAPGRKRKPAKDLSLAAALSGTSLDPCVGRFLEFRVVRDPRRPDKSRVPRR